LYGGGSWGDSWGDGPGGPELGFVELGVRQTNYDSGGPRNGAVTGGSGGKKRKGRNHASGLVRLGRKGVRRLGRQRGRGEDTAGENHAQVRAGRPAVHRELDRRTRTTVPRITKGAKNTVEGTRTDSATILRHHFFGLTEGWTNGDNCDLEARAEEDQTRGQRGEGGKEFKKAALSGDPLGQRKGREKKGAKTEMLRLKKKKKIPPKLGTNGVASTLGWMSKKKRGGGKRATKGLL